MSTTNLRRRLHHGDVDGRKNEHVDISSADSLNEPLLGKSNDDNFGSEVSLFSGSQLPRYFPTVCYMSAGFYICW
jgi:hypothetical protein